MITFKIIEALDRVMGGINIRSLFYADDGALLAGSVEEAARGIRELKRIGEYYGLIVNNEKSNCLLFNVKRDIQEIEGVKIVDKVIYLGVEVQSKRNMFEKQREVMVSKAKSLSMLTYSVVARSCHKVMIGKSFWKGVALPRILFVEEVVNLRKVDRVEIQRRENGAMRSMLEAPGAVAIAGMRGEVGIGTVESRVARCRIQYLRRVSAGREQAGEESDGGGKRRKK